MATRAWFDSPMMNFRPNLIMLALGIALGAPSGAVWADDPAESEQLSADSDSKRWWRDADLTLPGAFAEWHIFKKDGFRVDRSDGSLRLKFNANLWVDGGVIGASDALESAFAGLRGDTVELSRARVTAHGWLFERGDFKVQFELAQNPQVKDSWFRLSDIPYVGNVRIGNMREPFSLENSTGGGNLTFQSRALPVLALAPGRNIGIAANNTALDDRMTWGAGWFWNTGSYSNVLGAKDALSESIGSDLVARVTWLPYFEQRGRALIHLGLSVSEQRFNDEVRISARPETVLTNDNLVDTGKFSAERATNINPEFAMVSGPWLFQAEYLQSRLTLPNSGAATFRGFYGFVSRVLTGESRRFDRGAGVLDSIRPSRKFEWGGGGWGALEVALRLSSLDLNDGPLRGGRQTDLTAGLNWYISDNARFTLNYVLGRVKDRAADPTVDDGRVRIFQARLALAF